MLYGLGVFLTGKRERACGWLWDVLEPAGPGNQTRHERESSSWTHVCVCGGIGTSVDLFMIVVSEPFFHLCQNAINATVFHRDQIPQLASYWQLESPSAPPRRPAPFPAHTLTVGSPGTASTSSVCSPNWMRHLQLYPKHAVWIARYQIFSMSASEVKCSLVCPRDQIDAAARPVFHGDQRAQEAHRWQAESASASSCSWCAVLSLLVKNGTLLPVPPRVDTRHDVQRYD